MAVQRMHCLIFACFFQATSFSCSSATVTRFLGQQLLKRVNSTETAIVNGTSVPEAEQARTSVDLLGKSMVATGTSYKLSGTGFYSTWSLVAIGCCFLLFFECLCCSCLFMIFCCPEPGIKGKGKGCPIM
uniref:Uncharacterized protein n=1 Tax=Noctiluca scintillans TaxID=2966 RepID=A0A7S0ZYF0_NOCSC|mmetsp:Transcript_24311/g.63831  ORF Transcript_24311/g.63831 Transcript_24311/m.63831 type:complete len:130 (+) Transcript_24311:85-474(+)